MLASNNKEIKQTHTSWMEIWCSCWEPREKMAEQAGATVREGLCCSSYMPEQSTNYIASDPEEVLIPVLSLESSLQREVS